MKQFIPLGLCALLGCTSVFADNGLPDREPQERTSIPGGQTFQSFPLPGTKSSIAIDEPGVHRSASEVTSKEDVYLRKIKAIDTPSCIAGNCDFQELYEQTSSHKQEGGKDNINIESFAFGISHPGAKNALDQNLTGPCKPPYLCIEVNMSSAIIGPRDIASGLPTGKRQHKPMVIRFSPSSDGTDFGITIEADTDGDGSFEPFVHEPSLSSESQISGKTKPKEEKPTKKEYVGHVTLNR